MAKSMLLQLVCMPLLTASNVQKHFCRKLKSAATTAPIPLWLVFYRSILKQEMALLYLLLKK